MESKRDVSLTLNMTNGIFGGAVLTALLMCDSYVMSATKVAPPFSPSLAEGAGGWVIASEHIGRAWQPTVCEARIIEDSMPFDCFGYRLAMTQNSTYKNIHRHCERGTQPCAKLES